jgi:hypothetical protein
LERWGKNGRLKIHSEMRNVPHRRADFAAEADKVLVPGPRIGVCDIEGLSRGLKGRQRSKNGVR